MAMDLDEVISNAMDLDPKPYTPYYNDPMIIDNPPSIGLPPEMDLGRPLPSTYGQNERRKASLNQSFKEVGTVYNSVPRNIYFNPKSYKEYPISSIRDKVLTISSQKESNPSILKNLYLPSRNIRGGDSSKNLKRNIEFMGIHFGNDIGKLYNPKRLPIVRQPHDPYPIKVAPLSADEASNIIHNTFYAQTVVLTTKKMMYTMLDSGERLLNGLLTGLQGTEKSFENII